MATLSPNLHGQTCEILASAKNERLQSINLPDGRQIFMLGHNHGNRELPFEMQDLVHSRAQKLSDAAFHKEIEMLHERVSIAISEMKTDTVQLRELLAENQGIRFVGFETEDRYARTNLENYRLMLADFRRLMQSRDPISTALEMDLEQVILGAAGYLQDTESKLFNSREIRGFESANGTSASEKATLQADEALESLRKTAAGDSSFLGNLSGTEFQLSLLYDAYSTANDEEILKQVRSAAIPPRHRDATIQWVKLKLAEMAADKMREHDVVENILAAKSSGILIMGAAHLGGIMDRLRAKCLGLGIAL